ncbi:hypothetical protein G647_07816 [Cladophialophora carrionii CBS 160.54]|uniref:DUF7719 domain-containing protein n=1 Tax=Cladophialophora carrionii CBS 160.54 TaxID=1279043 RepID=V9D3J7_9EURO|nr:uncharacterized protein G647_07816 [Cladophialophora carrionii CBS 160.54]ETI21469.1 hypothetical protein G647_07816 [Cladophialophora carrionii CBS 160.54]
MNRKQRRARDSTDHISTADDIPLAPPPEKTKTRDPKTKTLLEIAAERQAELLGSKSGIHAAQTPIDADALKPENIVQVKIGPDGSIVPDSSAIAAATATATAMSGTPGGSSSSSSSEAVSDTPWLDTILLASSLGAVHFTLSVLAMHQYAEELQFQPLVVQTLGIAFPTLTVLIALFHGDLLPASLARLSPPAKGWVVAARSLVYLVVANVAGCYLIWLTNDKGYYAVMKNAPSVGTIWVWAVLEMGLLGALAGVLGPGVYAWWFGYGIM